MVKVIVLSLLASSLMLNANSNVVKQQVVKKVEEVKKIDPSKEELELLKKEVSSLNKKIEELKTENKASININNEVLVYLITSLNDIKQKITSIENNVIEYKFNGSFDPSVYAKYKVTSNLLVETNEINKVVNVYTKDTELIGKKDGNLLITSTGKVDLSKVVEIK